MSHTFFKLLAYPIIILSLVSCANTYSTAEREAAIEAASAARSAAREAARLAREEYLKTPEGIAETKLLEQQKIEREARRKAANQQREAEKQAEQQLKAERLKRDAAILRTPKAIGIKVCKVGPMTVEVTNNVTTNRIVKMEGVQIANLEQLSGNGENIQLRAAGWGKIDLPHGYPRLANFPRFGSISSEPGTVFWDSIHGWSVCPDSRHLL